MHIENVKHVGGGGSSSGKAAATATATKSSPVLMKPQPTSSEEEEEEEEEEIAPVPEGLVEKEKEMAMETGGSEPELPEPAGPPHFPAAGAGGSSSSSVVSLNAAGNAMAKSLLATAGGKKITVEVAGIQSITMEEREALFSQLGGPESLLTTVAEKEEYSELVKAATTPGSSLVEAKLAFSTFKINIVTAHLTRLHSQLPTRTKQPTTARASRPSRPAYNFVAARKAALEFLVAQGGEGTYANAGWPSRHELWGQLRPLLENVPNRKEFKAWWAGRVNAGFLAFAKKLHGEMYEKLKQAGIESHCIPSENEMKGIMAGTLNAAMKARHLHRFVFPPPEPAVHEFLAAAETQVLKEKNLPLLTPVPLAEIMQVAQGLQKTAIQAATLKHAAPTKAPEIVNPANPATKVTWGMLHGSILEPRYWQPGATERMKPSHTEPLRAALNYYNHKAAEMEMSGAFMRTTMKGAMELLFESRFKEGSTTTGFNLLEAMRQMAVASKVKTLQANWMKPVMAIPPALSAAPESNAQRLARMMKETKTAKAVN